MNKKQRNNMLKRIFNPVMSGKKIIILLLFVLFVTTIAFADYRITRGPDIGEIYFVGPTATGEGIYHSTDYGETAICMDSTLNTDIYFMSITADLTPGVLYGYSSPENLYISYDYGQEGSWIFRGSDYLGGNSGRNEGHLYKRISQHSEDYGISFINHSNQGFFGSLKSTEIDNEDNVCYAIVSQSYIPDSLWLLISYDNYENLEIQNVFNWNSFYYFSLTRGYETGEQYLKRCVYTGDGSRIAELWYSSDFGENWVFKNYLLSNCIVGGRQSGEIYVLANYTQLMGEIKHTYIYYSSDYGETFTVFHPFSYGPPPYYANFEANPTNGTSPLTVQFTDLSSGVNIQNWEWDFDNDGNIDSYEQNPEYTYQDTGSYSVKLKIYYGPLEDGFIKTNYIQVSDNSGIDNYELEITDYELNNYPNPFNPTTTISFNITANDAQGAKLEIYNVEGQKMKTLNIEDCKLNIGSVFWDGTDNNGKPVSSGIYFYKLNLKTSPIKKMIIIK